MGDAGVVATTKTPGSGTLRQVINCKGRSQGGAITDTSECFKNGEYGREIFGDWEVGRYIIDPGALDINFLIKNIQQYGSA